MRPFPEPRHDPVCEPASPGHEGCSGWRSGSAGLTERQCEGCTAKFKTLASSSQQYCSRFCLESNGGIVKKRHMTKKDWKAMKVWVKKFGLTVEFKGW